MTLKYLLISAALLTSFVVASHIRTFRQNLKSARQSGLRYVIVPFYIQQPLWLLLQGLALPLLERLPQRWTDPWLPLLTMGKFWHYGYEPFARIGCDTFIAVSSVKNILWTCDPEAVMELTARHSNLPKPADLMQILNIFGPTLTSSEGAEFRRYRKLAAPFFNEETHTEVWETSLVETQQLVSKWSRRPSNLRIDNVHDQEAKLMLHILTWVAYGKRMEWSDEHHQQAGLPAGHVLSFSEAISTMLDNMAILFLTPPLLLRYSPLQIHKTAWLSFREFGRYMEEMRDEKQAELREHSIVAKSDLIGSFVQASSFSGKQSQASDKDENPITPAAVLGNMFIFILAGHETSASTLHFLLVMLALFPERQRRLQDELDYVFGDRNETQWSFKDDFPRLLEGFTGALINEILRLFTVLPTIPKATGAMPQPLTLRSQTYTIPAQSLVLMNTSAIHRHPKYWPPLNTSHSSKNEGAPFPVTSFNPEMWSDRKARNGLDAFIPSASNTTTSEGVYVPFSEGTRACMGPRFARAGLCAAIAVIFKRHSITLDLSSIDGKDAQQKWNAAKDRAARNMSDGVSFFMNLKMSDEVPLRLEQRG